MNWLIKTSAMLILPSYIYAGCALAQNQNDVLQGKTQSHLLQGGTQSHLIQGNTQSTMLQTGTDSTLIQGGTQSHLIQGNVEKEAGAINVLILIDASQSMKEGLAGNFLGDTEQKMDIAKRVLQNAVARIPGDINLGLRVFGQSFSGDDSLDCRQTALLVPIGQGNRRSIIEKVRQLRPFGLTPLTYALMQAGKDLVQVQGEKTIILISDGAETCGGDPCAYIDRLRQMGIKIKIDIVGLGLKRDREAKEQLNCIAEKSGGKFYDANTAAELVDSINYSVKQAISGKVITRLKNPAINNEILPPELRKSK